MCHYDKKQQLKASVFVTFTAYCSDLKKKKKVVACPEFAVRIDSGLTTVCTIA